MLTTNLLEEILVKESSLKNPNILDIGESIQLLDEIPDMDMNQKWM